MLQIGYISKITMLRHESYGGCTMRKRAYFICIHADRCGLSDSQASDVLELMMATIKILELPATDFSSFVMSEDDPYCQQRKAQILSQMEANCCNGLLSILFEMTHCKHYKII